MNKLHGDEDLGTSGSYTADTFSNMLEKRTLVFRKKEKEEEKSVLCSVMGEPGRC